MSTTRKVLIAVAVVLALAAAAVFVVGMRWLEGGRAQRSGEASLAGLSAPVEVRWDRWGVPYVEAASGRDLATALGWLHANDRFTQMELGRRVAFGRLSEVAGARTLPLDRDARILRLGETAERLWDTSGAEARAWLTAYAAGVNAWLEARCTEGGGCDLPPDLRLLAGGGFRPEPWRPEDSLGFVLLMAQDLSFWNGRPEELHLQWLTALGEERMADLAPVPIHVPPALRSLARDEADEADEPPADGAAGIAAADPTDGSPRLRGGVAAIGDRNGDGSPGSNNWGVGDRHTAGPAPLLANDPHLPFRLPGTWYQVRLAAPDYDVAGMTLPGVPGVVIGRNRDLAWALTNVMLDDHDLFLEHVEESPEGPRVRRGDGWRAVEVEDQTIRVKDGEAVTLELRRTDRGPLLPADPERGLAARSLAWTLYEGGDPLSAFLALGRASFLEEVPEAIGGYVGPAQNLVVAHRDGGLLWTILGRLPARRAGDGWLPAPGWQEAYRWDGLLPREANPSVVRPASDLLVTANNDLLAGDAPADPDAADGLALLAPAVSADYDTSHRARRIRQVLDADSTWVVGGMAVLQNDVRDLYALEVRDAVLRDLGGLDEATLRDLGVDDGDRFVAGLDRLAAWDGRMTVEEGPASSAAALFAFFERELRRAIFADEAEVHGLRRFDDRERLLRVLSGDMSSAWFDDVATPDRKEDRQTMAVAAFEAALDAAVERWGEASEAWSYGDLHTLVQPHPLGSLPLLGRLFQGPPRPAPGSSTTVAAFGARWTDEGDLRVVHGASMRWATDLADPDGTLAVLPAGQAGHPRDPHYDDQVDDYLAGEVHPFPWSEAAVEAAAVERLRLVPAPVPPTLPAPALQ